MVFDAEGRLLSGGRVCRLRFAAGEFPPVNGFWSLAVCDLKTVSLVPNEIERYAIGDRTPGLHYAEDGSLTLWLHHQRPADPQANWLPTPPGNFMAVMRLYEPGAAALDGSYMLPRLEVAE